MKKTNFSITDFMIPSGESLSSAQHNRGTFFHPLTHAKSTASSNTLQACLELYHMTQDWMIKINQLIQANSLRQLPSDETTADAQTPLSFSQAEKLATYQLAHATLYQLQQAAKTLLDNQQTELKHHRLQFPIP